MSSKKATALAESAGGMISKKQIANDLGVTVRAIDTWRKSGRFPQPDLKVGGIIRWRRSTVDRWKEKHRPT